MTLEGQVSERRLEVSADSISMSISELTNLYNEGVLEIRPEFQRLLRWSDEQKSRLVESILLGIPLPSLFVSQSGEGGWELVDGLQRVGTILQVQGVLRGEDAVEMPPLVLSGTKYLPDLEGCTWGGEGEHLPDPLKLDFRLSRLDLKVIKRDSDPKAKFDLFQRLNSFGSTLTPQEIRSAMIAGTNGDCLVWLANLAKHPAFVESVALHDRLLDEQYDIELVLRFLMLHDIAVERPRLTDFSTRLDDWSRSLAEEPDLWGALATTFESTSSGLRSTQAVTSFVSGTSRRIVPAADFLTLHLKCLRSGQGGSSLRGSDRAPTSSTPCASYGRFRR